MAETYCDSDDVKLKQGSDSTALTSAQYTLLINEAEAVINAELRIDPIADATYAGLADSKKLIFRAAASAYAANTAILYNQSDYSASELTNLLNLNWTIFTGAMKLLKEKDTTEFIQGL